MDDHVLIKNAKGSKYTSVPEMPAGAVYDKKKGYWILEGEPMVLKNKDNGDRPLTKKADQETGEDIKSE